MVHRAPVSGRAEARGAFRKLEPALVRVVRRQAQGATRVCYRLGDIFGGRPPVFFGWPISYSDG